MGWDEKLKQRPFLGDQRKISSCLYCNYQGDTFTREHSPSKVFLDGPLPENLPITYSCSECNSSFSKDEEYLAAIIECMRCNTYEIEGLERKKVKKILEKNQRLHREIKNAFESTKGAIAIDLKRTNNIILKLARGHLTFEMCEIALCPPTALGISFIHNMNEEERYEFESLVEADVLYEISRVSMELAVIEYSLYSEKENKHVKVRKIVYPWQDVQDGRYRYMCAFNSGLLIVRVVISEFMFAEVIWDTSKIDDLREIEEKHTNENQLELDL